MTKWYTELIHENTKDDYYELRYSFLNESECQEGFRFRIVNFNGTGYDTVLKGIAFYDGIRHLYFGSNKQNDSNYNYGYTYCPSTSEYIMFFQKLKELEDKYLDN